MEYLIIGAAALLASGLTLFSGFGLGTLLLPVFVLFFPVDIAIGMTAIVHLLNNLFKLILLVRHADCRVFIKFGIPAVFAPIPGGLRTGMVFRPAAFVELHHTGSDLSYRTGQNDNRSAGLIFRSS